MKLYWYIWNEWVKVFFITAFLVVGMIVIQEVYSKLNDLIERGATALEILSTFLLTVPLYLPAIIPLVLLLSILFCVGSMHRKNEIVAMKSVGISLWRISQPLMVAGALCAGSILYLNASFIPWSVHQQEQLRNRIHHREIAGEPSDDSRVIRNLGSLNFRENRLWLMGTFDPFARVGKQVAVYEMDDSGRETYRIRARRAEYHPETGYWEFQEGQELFYREGSEEPFRNQSFEQLKKTNYRESPQIMVALREKPQDLSLYELSRVLTAYEGFENPEIVPYEVRFYRILASPLSCFLVVGFGVPFAASGVRTNPMIGISKAFGMFLMYFVVSNISTIFGEGGWIPPEWSAVIPLIFIGLFAARVFIRAE